MGNAYVIYDTRCINVQCDDSRYCPVYREHLETLKFINEAGKIFEKLVYQNFNLSHVPDDARISWYQLMGQSVKRAGQSMSSTDPFRKYVIMSGKGEKLIGQMEDQFAMVCNSLVLQPIQEMRNYSMTTLDDAYNLFIENDDSVKYILNQISCKGKNDQGYEDLLSFFNERQATVRNLHLQLHNHIIYVYETILKIKTRLPAVIEYQMQYNMYSTAYLEFLLHLFKENKAVRKQVVPLKNYKGTFGAYIPDYRRTIKDQSIPGEKNIYPSQRTRSISADTKRVEMKPRLAPSIMPQPQPKFVEKRRMPQPLPAVVPYDPRPKEVYIDIPKSEPENVEKTDNLTPPNQYQQPQPLYQPKKKKVLCGGREKKPRKPTPQVTPTTFDDVKPIQRKHSPRIVRHNKCFDKTGRRTRSASTVQEHSLSLVLESNPDIRSTPY